MKKKNSPEDFSGKGLKDKNDFERFDSGYETAPDDTEKLQSTAIESQLEEELISVPEKIQVALEKQLALYKRKSEILARLHEEEQMQKKKRKVIKAALKKAVEKKLDKAIISLIKDDLVFVSEAREKCNEMISNERIELEKIAAIITTLKTLI